MNKENFEALLDEMVKNVGQEAKYASARKNVLLAYTKLQREIDRLEEDVILQAYRK